MNRTTLSKLGGIAGIFVPVAIHYFCAILVEAVLSGLLIAREHITDAAEISRRFTEDGFGVMATGLTALITIPVFYIMFRVDQRGEERLVCRKPLAWLLLIPFGIFAALGLNELISILRLNDIFDGYANTQKVLFSGPWLLSMVSIGFLVPVSEELMFRGLMFGRMKNLCKPITAMLLTSFLFGAYHMNLVQFLYAFLVGILLIFVCEKMGTVLAPIVFHAAANSFVLLAQGNPLFDRAPFSYLFCIVGLAGTAASILYYRKKKETI